LCGQRLNTPEIPQSPQPTVSDLTLWRYLSINLMFRSHLMTGIHTEDLRVRNMYESIRKCRPKNLYLILSKILPSQINDTSALSVQSTKTNHGAHHLTPTANISGSRNPQFHDRSFASATLAYPSNPITTSGIENRLPHRDMPPNVTETWPSAETMAMSVEGLLPHFRMYSSKTGLTV
jgi:hypothetical protein